MAQNVTARSKDYAQWYLDVINAAGLADYSPVRGCMVIKPHGYAIWERLQQELDWRFKATGHVNAYFPLFIPLSFLAKEAKHVEGFAMECAVVTHSGLEKDPEGAGLRPKGKLEEPLVVRPTSETIIGHSYAQWIQSWRDLPVLVNQWANIVRWEMRTRLFLRTMEFLWQEGHTAHETAEEAQAETIKMLGVYSEVAEKVLAIPVHKGRKTAAERFAGADETYCIEALMQDGKALQAGTSHNLGQNFAKAFDIKFQTRDQQVAHVWTTSWGMTTRMIGAVIMTHADDEGLILPPKVAPVVAAIVPIYKTPEEREATTAFAKKLLAGLAGLAVGDVSTEGEIAYASYGGARSGQRIALDLRDGLRPPEKFFWWEQRGVPIRFEIGPKDLANQSVMSVRRHDRGKAPVKAADLGSSWLDDALAQIQQALLDRAEKMRASKTYVCDDYAEFKKRIESEPGFYLMHWDGTAETEAKIKEETKATIRCIPLADSLASAGGPVSMREPGRDPCSGKPSSGRVIYARAY
jgi:prolyl-tRNA synthetase